MDQKLTETLLPCLVHHVNVRAGFEWERSFRLKEPTRKETYEVVQ